MSTETTNKKIKIDNGTTFGRTYTDKAVDELLKNIGGGGTSVIELTDKNGTITSAQLGKINANPQNFAFKYNGKILLFARSSSTTYQYCNNTTNSSDNNVMTTSTLLTIESSTGVYTISENVHNVVANSIHPVNGGDLTNIQVGSKVYSIPSGGGGKLEGFSIDVSATYNPETKSFSGTLTDEQWTKVQNKQIYWIEVVYINNQETGETASTNLLYNGPFFGEAYAFTDGNGSMMIINDKSIDGMIIKVALTIDTQNTPTSQLIPSITTSNEQQNLTIGNGLEIKDGALKTIIPTLPTDASSKTYTLQTVNGALAWTDAIGDINTILDNINGEVI